MKILFMGTPDIASGCLQELIDKKYDIIGVVTQPDKQVGRGKKIVFSPVKQVAIENNLPVYQPIKAKEESFVNEIKELNPDAVRGNLLEAVGYKTQLLEFIDIAHSPKNILIRASKSNISKQKIEKSLTEVEKLREEFNFNPTLYNLLKQDNLI